VAADVLGKQPIDKRATDLDLGRELG